MPVNDEGHTIEPQVSVPIAKAASPAETIAPEPEDEPHVQHPSFQGFFAAPLMEADAKRYPMPPASSIMAALPSSTAPACSSFLITVAFSSNFWLAYGRAPHCVGYPFTTSRSFAA